MRKTQDKPKLRDILQNAKTILFKTIKVIKTEESLRNCYSWGEPKDSDNERSCGVLKGILEKKKDMGEKITKSEYNTNAC